MKRVNLTAPFVTLMAWLAAGGADSLKQSLGRQYLQWVGVAIALASLVGVWGIWDGLLLTEAEFYQGIGVALGFVLVDHIGTRLVINKPDVIEAPKG